MYARHARRLQDAGAAPRSSLQHGNLRAPGLRTTPPTAAAAGAIAAAVAAALALAYRTLQTMRRRRRAPAARPQVGSAAAPSSRARAPAHVVNRVFKLKLNDMIRQLRNGTIFSKPDGSPWKSRYIMWVVEFQKRGLPHAHIAVRLEGEDDAQPREAAEIDRHIYAKIPAVTCARGDDCACDQHRVNKIVRTQLLHGCRRGVCIPTEPNKPQVCGKRFPKPLCAETTLDSGGFPCYARGAADINVVPYNAKLLLRYDAHINVELCVGAKYISYLHKYTH